MLVNKRNDMLDDMLVEHVDMLVNKLVSMTLCTFRQGDVSLELKRDGNLHEQQQTELEPQNKHAHYGHHHGQGQEARGQASQGPRKKLGDRHHIFHFNKSKVN